MGIDGTRPQLSINKQFRAINTRIFGQCRYSHNPQFFDVLSGGTLDLCTYLGYYPKKHRIFKNFSIKA